MLLRSLPSLTSCDAGFRDWFHSKWGHENCVVWGRALRADFVPHVHSLSIRAAWGGMEHCHVGGRTVGVDDDTFLILNRGRMYSTSIRAEYPVESLAICFRPGLAEAAYAAMSVSLAKALADGAGLPERMIEFSENLQAHDRLVSPVLRFIKAHVAQGLEGEGWYEEQLHFLLERMRQLRDRTLLQIERLQFIRGATRREIYRRIAVATDFIHTNYAQDLDLEDPRECRLPFEVSLPATVHARARRDAVRVPAEQAYERSSATVANHPADYEPSRLMRRLRTTIHGGATDPQPDRMHAAGASGAGRRRAFEAGAHASA